MRQPRRASTSCIRSMSFLPMPRPRAPWATMSSLRYALNPRSWAHANPTSTVSSAHTNANSPAVSIPFAKVASDQSSCQKPGSASISRRMAARSILVACRITPAVRSCGCAQHSQDIHASFRNTDLRYLDHLVPAAFIPCRRSSINARRFNERLIALGIIGVDGLQLIFRQGADLLQHAECVHDTTLEEDEASLRRVLTVLLDVQAENGLGELQWWRAGSQ